MRVRLDGQSPYTLFLMLVLASASPRRRDLLAQAGYTCTVLPASICEDPHPGERPIPYVLRLARQKAEAVAASPEFFALAARHAAEPLLVLGADTTVVAPTGEMLAKPESDADARRMLRLLAGATHQVITGVALVAGSHTEVAAEVTHVTFLSPSDDEIARYVATGEPHGKAGAYAIQGQAARWIPRVHGCYFNVVGLPLALVATMIAGSEQRIARAQVFAETAHTSE
jgi:septum formation protein